MAYQIECTLISCIAQYLFELLFYQKHRYNEIIICDSSIGNSHPLVFASALCMLNLLEAAASFLSSRQCYQIDSN